MRILTKTLTMAIAVALVILVLLLCACQKSDSENKINVQSDTLYVEKVENMPKDFILGMDASCVPSLEASGVKYYDHNGEEKDVYEILSTNGVIISGCVFGTILSIPTAKVTAEAIAI